MMRARHVHTHMHTQYEHTSPSACAQELQSESPKGIRRHRVEKLVTTCTAAKGTNHTASTHKYTHIYIIHIMYNTSIIHMYIPMYILYTCCIEPAML